LNEKLKEEKDLSLLDVLRDLHSQFLREKEEKQVVKG
jgi:hypothetical protein